MDLNGQKKGRDKIVHRHVELSPCFTFGFRHLHQRRVYITQSGFSQKKRSRSMYLKQKRIQQYRKLRAYKLRNGLDRVRNSRPEAKNMQKTSSTSQFLHMPVAGEQQTKTETIKKLISVKPIVQCQSKNKIASASLLLSKSCIV